MKYAPQLTWEPGPRSCSAECLHCRWAPQRTDMTNIRKHALANPGHRIVVTTRTETVVTTDPTALVTINA